MIGMNKKPTVKPMWKRVDSDVKQIMDESTCMPTVQVSDKDVIEDTFIAEACPMVKLSDKDVVEDVVIEEACLSRTKRMEEKNLFGEPRMRPGWPIKYKLVHVKILMRRRLTFLVTWWMYLSHIVL
ncbi:hypothetical protein L7F22_025186 [Adiantum nelumboides]|nr:hypothetical protein [Adiantum nelumboides]